MTYDPYNPLGDKPPSEDPNRPKDGDNVGAQYSFDNGSYQPAPPEQTWPDGSPPGPPNSYASPLPGGYPQQPYGPQDYPVTSVPDQNNPVTSVPGAPGPGWQSPPGPVAGPPAFAPVPPRDRSAGKVVGIVGLVVGVVVLVLLIVCCCLPLIATM
ncbi:MAG: hypothetical protein ACRDXX_13640 [Stackebrandtia sp.]